MVLFCGDSDLKIELVQKTQKVVQRVAISLYILSLKAGS